MSPYVLHLAILAGIYVLMTLAFNLVAGYAGLLNLGQIGLIGIGAYTSAILSRTYHWNVFVAMGCGALAGALSALILALAARKLKNDYFALVSLGFSFVAAAIFLNVEPLTRGTLGIPGIPRPGGFSSQTAFFSLVLALDVLVYFLLNRLTDSPFGRALEAVRDDEEVAASLGKPVFKLKAIALVVSGLICGLSGALLGSYIQFISPNSFWLDLLVWAIAGIMIGGMASMPGAVLGTLALFFISEPLRFLSLPSALVGPLRLFLFMLILLLIVIYRPRGIMGRAQLEN